MKNNNVDAFFALVRSGLWADVESTNIRNLGFMEALNWDEVYGLAEEQSVTGVVLVGIEHSNVKPPQELLLQWIGEVQMLEQQNKAMNKFIAELIERLQKADIYTLLVKGQGLARCYERPLWRQCGDIDFFLSKENYNKAKGYLLPLAQSSDKEYDSSLHLAMEIDSWMVELHGYLRCGLSSRIDKAMDDIKNDVLYNGDVRSWMNGTNQIFLLGVNCDVLYVFTHLLKHFYKEGLGLRQICDWCRLLWKYRSNIDVALLEKRLRKMGLMTEWKAFGAFAVAYLGMPADAMPLYSEDAKWKKKADMICAFILEVGNMGHNRDMSYFDKYPYMIRKVCSMGRRCRDLIRHARIFPLDSLRFFPRIMFNGLRSAIRGE